MSSFSKAMVFVGAFCVSFMAIYFYYYYQVAPTPQATVVGYLDTMETVQIVATPLEPFEQGMDVIWSVGNSQAQWLAGERNDVHAHYSASHSLIYAGPFNREKYDSLIEDLLTKFPNHPPLTVARADDAKKGLLFSYYFNNISLPVDKAILASPPGLDLKEYYLVNGGEGGIRGSGQNLAYTHTLPNGDQLIGLTFSPNSVGDGLRQYNIVKEQEQDEVKAIGLPRVDCYLVDLVLSGRTERRLIPEEYISANMQSHIKLRIAPEGELELAQAIEDEVPLVQFIMIKKQDELLPYLAFRIESGVLLPRVNVR